MAGLRLTHYLVAVRSLADARRGYERLLGMSELASGEDPAEGARWLALGGAVERVRLVEPVRPGGVLDALMRRRATERNPGGEGFYRGVWETPDTEALASHWRAAGVAFERGDAGALRPDHRRTHGVRMEIREAAPGGSPAPGDDGSLLRLSHIGVAVRSHEAAAGNLAGLFGMETIGERQEIPAAALATQWVGFGTRRIFTLLLPLAEASPVAGRMRALELDSGAGGEGVYIVAWATADPDRLGDELEAAGVAVARAPGPSGSILRPHPRLTGGAYIEVLPLSMNTDQWA